MILLFSFMGIFQPIVLAILSMLIIWRASDGFETASDYIGRNLSDGIRGATINAIASSIPELLTTIFFLLLLSDVQGFAGGIGTTAGSAIFNGMVIPALVIFVVMLSRSKNASAGDLSKGIQISRKVVFRDGIALILCELLLILLLGGTSLYWYHGLALMAAYFVYVVFMFTTSKSSFTRQDGEEEDEEDSEEDDEPASFVKSLVQLDLQALIIGKKAINTQNAWALLLISVAIIAIACFILVAACEQLGTNLGIGTYIIAVLIASAATSVPDTLISMRDAQKGEYDDAISNALGSNIFDICVALGLPLFIYTLINGPINLGLDASAELSENISELRIILLGMTILAFLTYAIGKYMNMLKAFLLFGMYLSFVLFIIGKVNDHPISISISTFVQETFINF